MNLNERYLGIEGSFGGRQEWLFNYGATTSFISDRACGVVAAANIITYLANSDKSLSELSQGEGKVGYILILKELLKYMKPMPYGIPTLKALERGVIAYARARGIELISRKESWPFTKRLRSSFIKRGLLLNTPVLLLTWSGKEKELHNHWVTVTGIRNQYRKSYLTVSNWGEKKEYSSSENSIYKGAIYFIKRK